MLMDQLNEIDLISNEDIYLSYCFKNFFCYFFVLPTHSSRKTKGIPTSKRNIKYGIKKTPLTINLDF